MSNDIQGRFPHKASGLRFSNQEVLNDPAGYFIGRVVVDEDEPDEEQNMRESEYFQSKRDAEMALELSDYHLVVNDENTYFYATGLPKPLI